MDSSTSPDPNPVSIACGADDRFAIGLAITLYSALTNITADSVDFFVIDGGVSDRNKAKLERILRKSNVTVAIKWILPSMESLNGLKVSAELSTATYFRLLLPTLLPHGINKVIYLDCDLVVEGNLVDLWETEMGDCPLLAVQDFCFPHVSFLSPELQVAFRDYEVKAGEAYFNAGVLLINLKQWRDEALSQRVLEFFSKNCYRHDQDGLNAVMAKRWRHLDLEWNVQQFFGAKSLDGLLTDTSELMAKALIIHYSTPTKPWHRFFRQHGASRFNYYLKKSQWLSKSEYAKWFVNIRIPQLFTLAAANVYRFIKRISFVRKNDSQTTPS